MPDVGLHVVPFHVEPQFAAQVAGGDGLQGKRIA
jgi:hypothetical protein